MFLQSQMKWEHEPFFVWKVKTMTMIMISLYTVINKKHKLVNSNIRKPKTTIKASVTFFSIGFVMHSYLHNSRLYKFVINTFQAGRF